MRIGTAPTKYLTIEQLTKVLKEVPPDHKLSCNSVGNLMVLNPQFKSVGFIDFVGTGEFEKWEPES